MDSATPTVRELYSDWFLDYASYVILERAVPHLHDGLKPVHRRILHSLRDLEDGRYNKVANVVGHTMKYHPHGDASIADALVQLGQRDLLIDTQGNWGNLLTGDPAAAPRYIEARLSKFALDVLFAPKITEWQTSYDGRNREPVTLPAKFPLLLAQGVEGIAVGLSCRILPHNFIEIIEASIACLRKQPFTLLPDFPTGGIIDASEYRDGERTGRVRVRAQLDIEKNRLIRIRQIPPGTTTSSLIDSILNANEKGKIKVSRIEDNTSDQVDILIHLPAGSDPEQICQALYAFTDCEFSLSPNACVIDGEKPRFLGVSELLKLSTHHTRDLLGKELEVKLHQLQEKWHFASLEKIFIEKRIYRDIEECETWQSVLDTIKQGLKPYEKQFLRPITEDDIVRLTEIKIKRISKFDHHRAEEEIAALNKAITTEKKNLRNLTRYTIRWFESLLKKYGKGRERKSTLREFERVNASKVALATETLYLNRKDGFAGYGLKRDEPISKCSTMDDIITITRDGTLTVSKIQEKASVGKNPALVDVFKKNPNRIYSMIYRDGRDGPIYAKRFTINGVTRDRKYPLTKGTPGSRVLYLAAHDNTEDSNNNLVRVILKPALRLRNLERDFLFGDLAIKNRSAMGNIITKHAVDRVIRTPKT